MKSANLHPVRSALLVFDKGDEFNARLKEYAEANNIRGAWFTALGAFRRATIAYWNPSTLAYEKIEVNEQVEVLSIIGNVATDGNETRIHAHTTLGRKDGSTIGGHLMSGEVFPTLELQVTVMEAPIVRKLDPATKLPLIAI